MSDAVMALLATGPGETARGRGRAKADQAYDHLRQAIITMRLAPGSALPEKEICAELGFSRTPMREAVLRLAQEGLIDIVPSEGTFVRKISLHQVIEGHLVRSSLELRMVRLAARAYDGAHDADFELLMFMQAEARRRGDHDRSLSVDMAFHRLICTVAGFPDIWRVVQVAAGQLDRVRRFSYTAGDISGEVEQEHRAIHAALQARDEALAHRLMRSHLDDLGEVLDFMRETHPEIFLPSDSPSEMEALLSPPG
ncbi:GntR family transcriptional regulator [Albimonas sp. CAU 1670]|uniref:GntR family transcriptional regulator n=1 Tax=Albimonas sp. CAU 1670 TaxID=3032599 RepID=UPI0023DAA3AD|nr:GntR family transcriptional regulator [Albimonas sp. CAU 1670]MDF2235282.1 GntR family transcriptional regulator [Albimonas sp. CAU 1670]